MTALAIREAQPVASRRISAIGVLRLEGLALFLAAISLYAHAGNPWQQFALLFLAPDLSFIFYLAGSRAGAFGYNMAHSTLGPLTLAGISAASGRPDGIAIALVWLAHIGLDRALGYGLKRTSGFGDTHLGKIGKARVASGE